MDQSNSGQPAEEPDLSASMKQMLEGSSPGHPSNDRVAKILTTMAVNWPADNDEAAVEAVMRQAQAELEQSQP